MEIFSQKDPRFSGRRLGNSKITIGSHGCFLMSMATLYQGDPIAILNHPGAITPTGLLVSGKVAELYGGSAQPRQTTPPKGWCIGVTNKYAPDFPTHFFLVHPQRNLMVDPLDFPAEVVRLNYNVIEYRPFSNVKFIEPLTWQEEAEKWATENGIIGSGWESPDTLMSQVRVAGALKKLYEKLNK